MSFFCDLAVRISGSLVLGCFVSFAVAAPDGEQLFKMNCAACHMPDEGIVGPSMVEMRGLYLGKEEDFLKWCVAPKKKRPNAIEMPSMVHVGDAGLREIYKYVMKASAGLVEKKKKEGDPFAQSPTQMARPQVMRIFMPNAGPAAIAVALDDVSSLCWDAGECRLRYAWTGGFIDGYPYWKGNGSQLAVVVGEVRYVETQCAFAGLSKEKKFLGYRMEGGLPLMRYRVGEREVTESFRALANGAGIVRKFTMASPPKDGLELRFQTDSKAKYSSDKGKWNGSVLELSAEDATAFQITISYL